MATPIEKKMKRPNFEVISIAETITPINSTISIRFSLFIFSPPLQVLVYHLLTFNPIMIKNESIRLKDEIQQKRARTPPSSSLHSNESNYAD